MEVLKPGLLKIPKMCNFCTFWPWSDFETNYLFRHTSRTDNFYRILFILKHPNSRLTLIFGFIGINPWFIATYDALDVFWVSVIEPTQSFPTPINASPLKSQTIVYQFGLNRSSILQRNCSYMTWFWNKRCDFSGPAIGYCKYNFIKKSERKGLELL